MMKIIVDDIEYEIIENYRDCYDKDLLLEKITDYFYDYDYILGDFAYGKLRLKGFCNKDNPKFNKINDINIKKMIIKISYLKMFNLLKPIFVIICLLWLYSRIIDFIIK